MFSLSPQVAIASSTIETSIFLGTKQLWTRWIDTLLSGPYLLACIIPNITNQDVECALGKRPVRASYRPIYAQWRCKR